MFTTLSQVPGLLPQIGTRRALIVINLQNDALFANDDLYITKNHEFVDRIKEVVPYFRSLGEVVWVRTELGAKSYPASPGSAYIEEEVAKIDEQNREEQLTKEGELEDDTVSNGVNPTKPEQPNVESGSPNAQPTSHPTSRSQAMMKRASAKARAEQRTANMDVFNDDEGLFEEQSNKPRKGQQAKFFIAGTLGAEIADQLLSVVDETKDLIVTKNHYSAFDQTSLLMSLRMKLVTDVYLCGCLTNVGVYATAADAVQHGLGVTVIEDCLGYRSEAKHEDAMRQMADIMGVNGIDSEEIIEEAGGKAPPDAEVQVFTGPGPEGITLHDLSIDVQSAESAVVAPAQEPYQPNHAESNLSVSPTNEPKDAAKADPDPHTQPSASVDPGRGAEDTSAASEIAQKQPAQRSISVSNSVTPLPSPGISSGRKRDSWMSVGSQALGPSDSIGAGDSRIIHDALSSSLAGNAFQLLKEEISWQTMHHRSGAVPRLVAVQGEIEDDGSIPIYRHPADESPRLLAFSSTIRKIKNEAEKLLEQPFNHALIQLYRDGNDNISEHSDKTLDIIRGSSIVNVSIGAQRVMILRTKKARQGRGSESPVNAPRQMQRTPMPHNSVFVLGPQTNLHWLHGVRADKRSSQQKSSEERSFGGERISITFRQIGTFMDPVQKTIWGSGATRKSKATAKRITTADVEMEAMIMSFGKENHQSDFDWDKQYGRGFDVINLVSEKTKLTLCDDKVANLRVKLSLAEKRITYVRTERIASSPPQESRTNRCKSHPRTHGLSNPEKPIFQDVDQDSSETEGDLAILFYLEKFYPFAAPKGASARELHRATALIFTRASKSNELLFWWRELQAMSSSKESSSLPDQQPTTETSVTPKMPLLKEFHEDLDIWEEYAAKAEYIAGDFWTIIDCAFWPVLDDIISNWDKFDGERYPRLSAYHQRVYSRECVRKILDAGI